jgi:glycosyltransferase involved in cell wall biosynthesis
MLVARKLPIPQVRPTNRSAVPERAADIDRVKILYCIRSLEVGGSQKQLATLTSLLAAHGWEVHVAVLHPGRFESLLDSRTTLHRIASSRNSDPLILWRLVRLMRTIRPDIVQTWLPQMDIFAGTAALLCRKAWILSERSSERAYSKIWPMKLRQRLGSFASGIVANSRGGLEFWRGRNRRVAMHRAIPNAISIHAETRDEPLTSGTAPMVLYAGRLDPEKRLSRLLEALVTVRRELPATAVICGEGLLGGELRLLANELGIGDFVELTGYVANPSSIMRRADLFVSLGTAEGAPNAVQEAVVAGVPVLLSDIPAHRELLDESSAIFVDGDDSSAIANAILSSLRDANAAQARARTARRHAENWSPQAVAAAYDGFYREVLGR